MRRVIVLGSVSLLALAACAGEDSKPVAPPSDSAIIADAALLPAALGDHPAAGALSSALEELQMPYADPGAPDIDLTDLQAALPDGLELSWSSQSRNAETGATEWADFELGLTIGDASFAILADDVLALGLDTEFLAARLRGERLGDTAPLAARIEAENVRLSGMDLFLETIFAGFFNSMDEAETFDELDLDVSRFEVSQDRLVITGLALRPFEYVPLGPDQLPEDAGQDEEFTDIVLPAIQTGQLGIALIRSLQADAIYTSSTRAALDYGMAGGQVAYTYETGPSLVAGMVGYDIGASYAQDVRTYQNQEMDLSELDDEIDSDTPFEEFGLEQSTSYELGASSGMRLDKLMGYLARSEIPPLAERDLLSLGRFDLYGVKLNYFDEDVISAGRLSFAADEFESYIPERISVEADDLIFNIDGFTGLLVSFAEAFSDEASAPQDETGEGAEDPTEPSETELLIQGMREAQQRLPEFGLETISLDYAGMVSWAPADGAFQLSSDAISEGFGSEKLSLGLVLPDYESLLALSQAEQEDEDGMEPADAYFELLEERFAFTGFGYKTTDLGGYDKLFGLAQAIGQAYPDEGWGAMLGSMTPEQMRSNLATMVRMGKQGVADEFPPAADWFEAVASFLATSGGSLTISVAPPEPVTSATFDELEELEEEPQQIVDRLGISVVHEAESEPETPQ